MSYSQNFTQNFPSPVFSIGAGSCPYLPFHVIDVGQTASVLAPAGADDVRHKDAAVTPSYDMNVAYQNLDQEILFTFPPVDAYDGRTYDSAAYTPSQASGTDAEPQRVAATTQLPAFGIGSAFQVPQLPPATPDAEPVAKAPSADSLPAKVVECR